MAQTNVFAGFRTLSKKSGKKNLKKTDEQTATSGDVHICPLHDGEKIYFYCITCECLVCQECIATNHEQPQHNIKHVKTLRAEQMKDLDKTLKSLEKDAAIYEKKSHKTGDTEQNILSCIKQEELKIDQAVALAVANAHEQGDLLKAKIRGHNDPKLKECQRQKALLQKHAHDVRETVAKSKAMSESTSNQNFVMQYKALTDKLKSIQGLVSEEHLVQYNPREVEFTAEQVTAKLGTLQLKSMPLQQQNRHKLSSELQSGIQSSGMNGTTTRTARLVRQLDLSFEFSTFASNVLSIASNESCNTLVISEWNGAHVYCQQPNGQYKRKTSLNVIGKKFVSGRCYAAAAPNNTYLLVKGTGGHVYSASGRYINPFYTTEDKKSVKLNCISITQDDKVVVGDIGRSVITVHTLDGTLIKEIKTSIHPQNIAVINDSKVAVSEDTSCKVCLIDLESGTESSSIDINRPQSMCYDAETDCLLIGRAGRLAGECMIEQHSVSTGDMVASIAQSVVPQAIAFTGSNSLLAVGAGHEVKFYKGSTTLLQADWSRNGDVTQL